MAASRRRTALERLFVTAALSFLAPSCAEPSVPPNTSVGVAGGKVTPSAELGSFGQPPRLEQIRTITVSY
jgi:hypothetical protein